VAISGKIGGEKYVRRGRRMGRRRGRRRRGLVRRLEIGTIEKE